MVRNKRIIFRLWYGGTYSSKRYRLDFVKDHAKPMCEIFLVSEGVSFYNTTIHAENEVDLVFIAIAHVENKIGPDEIRLDF